MARPRSASDEEVLTRISEVLTVADAGWTLAGAAEAAGLHPATLIKRFGSRRGVLLALSRWWLAGLPSGPATDDPHGELLAWAASLSTSGATQARVLARIDMLAEDLRDPELRALLHSGWQRQLDHLSLLVEGAVRDGRLGTAAPPPLVARLLLDAATGTLLRAAVAPDPSDVDPRTTVHDLLEALT